MTQDEVVLLRKLKRLLSLQIKHHGHLCGFGMFKKKSEAKLNYCYICTPSEAAVKEARRALAGGSQVRYRG